MLPDIGPVIARKLISTCGSPSMVFAERKGKLLKIPGIGAKTLQALSNADGFKEAEKELHFIRTHKITVHYFLCQNFPTRLKQCPDSPILLYSKGSPQFETAKVLAVVGTRRSTPYGEQICQNLIAGLATTGVLIISGLAYGIDACAHRAALANGLDTVAVLGHGLDRIYPFAHRTLASQMISQGGLVTDFPSGTKPDRNNFPSRNRIIAGLSDAILVVEAAEKGGALITADIGISYDREVMAIPGRVDDELSKGTNQLIHDNKAALVTDARQVMDWMSWDMPKDLNVQTTLFEDLTDEERNVVEVIRYYKECSLDTVAMQSGLSVPRTSSLLFMMEIKGLVRSLPGKIFRLL